MALSSNTLGNFELFSIETGSFRLDGGAMFGVVPKTLWSKGIPVDEHNRIPMGMRCLLIKSRETGKVYLVDAGIGHKFGEKEEHIYQVDFSKHTLESSLKFHGFGLEDVTDIIFTHLHFDHCGGASGFNAQREPEIIFPNAALHINEKHWETAFKPNAREKASFLPENLQPIVNSEKLNLVEDRFVFEPGLSVITMNGHTIGQQLPVIRQDGKTLVFMADLLPTHVHVPLAWVMGYDMQPLLTLKEKEAFLSEAADKKYFLFLEHDAFEEVIQVEKDGRKFRVCNTLKLNDI